MTRRERELIAIENVTRGLSVRWGLSEEGRKAILDGDPDLGLSAMMRIERALDTLGVSSTRRWMNLRQKAFRDQTAVEVLEKSGTSGAVLVLRVLEGEIQG